MPTILVVDDQLLVLNVVCQTLMAQGYRILSATCARAALEVCESSRRLDLLITDVEMPGTSGPNLAKAISEKFPDLPVLYMTGYLLRPPIDASYNGIEGRNIIMKPFLPTTLVKVVNRILNTG
jgi:DNA-binding NtrC family response regulator